MRLWNRIAFDKFDLLLLSLPILIGFGLRAEVEPSAAKPSPSGAARARDAASASRQNNFNESSFASDPEQSQAADEPRSQTSSRPTTITTESSRSQRRQGSTSGNGPRIAATAQPPALDAMDSELPPSPRSTQSMSILVDWFTDWPAVDQISLAEWHDASSPADELRTLGRNADAFVSRAELAAAIQREVAASPSRSPAIVREANIGNGWQARAINRAVDHSRFGNPPSPSLARPAMTPPASSGSPSIGPSRSAPSKTTGSKSASGPTPAAPRYDLDALATVAEPLNDGTNPYWLMRNQENEQQIAAGRQANVLFLGDSVTDLLSSGAGQPLWDGLFAPLGALNFAVGGSMTSQVLWQVEQGQIAEVSPRVIVLLIGSNNLGVGQSPAATANGITKIVNELQGRLPKSRILLLGLLPRSHSPFDPIRSKIAEVNRMISRLDDGNAIRFLDFGNQLLETDGSLSTRIMPDFLHPSVVGYQIYTSHVWPILREILNRP